MSNEEIALKLTEIYYSKYTTYPAIEFIVDTYKEVLNRLNGNYTC